ncbi:MAG: ABC transporter permease, partial [Acidimicrobiales bacterium]|nr:ABC transporter permease [Acidimicrobiales bacterium]
MLRLTLKNLMANRVRFAMTTGAVILAVSFVVSSFVLTDGLRSSFNDLSTDIAAGTDLEVRPDVVDLAPADLETVRGLDGVAAAEARIEGEDNEVVPVKPDGDLIGINGPPQLSFAWMESEALSQFRLVEGSAPEPGSFTMDLDAAAEHGFVVGDTYSVASTTGTRDLTLSGLVSFGADNDTIGATLMQFHPDELPTMLDDPSYDGITVALDDDADTATVQRAIGAALGSGVETVDNATLVSEQQAEFNANIDLIGNVLLGFSAITLFVSIFIIYNTFSIVLSQRTRELALLRTVGADPKQLRRSVLGEATVIGVIAAIGGTVAGVAVALGLRRVFEALGASLPDFGVVVSTRTMILAGVVGVGATLVSAFGPTRKASRVPAIAALREGAGASETSTRTRVLA